MVTRSSTLWAVGVLVVAALVAHGQDEAEATAHVDTTWGYRFESPAATSSLPRLGGEKQLLAVRVGRQAQLEIQLLTTFQPVRFKHAQREDPREVVLTERRRDLTPSQILDL